MFEPLFFLCLFVDASPQPECQVAEPALNQKEEVVNGEEVCNPTNDVEKPVVEETLVPEDINEVPNNVAVAPISSPPVPLEEAPKKSYASIVGFQNPFIFLYHAQLHGIKSVP
jgi:hypothetical protein